MVGGKVEETGRIHSCYSCSLTEISWALSATKCDWALSVALSILGSKSEGATSPHVVVHSCTMQIRLVYNVLISLVSPHVHLVCLDSVGCCMFGQPCCQTQQQRPSSLGGNHAITVPLRGKVKGRRGVCRVS